MNEEEQNAATAKEEDAKVGEDATEEDGGEADRKRAESPDIPPESVSSKRVRKSAETFEPTIFNAHKEQITIVQGRGKRLADIPNVKKKIESYSNNADDLAAAHKLVFTFRGKIGKAGSRHRKEQLLAFSGYLPPLVEGQDEEERDKIDEEAETKMSKKAYSLTIAELKAICDVFDVDRSKIGDKDTLIDRLLDFLGQPDEKLTKAKPTTSKAKPKKSAASPEKPKAKEAKKKSAKKEAHGESKEDDTEEEPGEDGMPSDETLRKWVRAYVCCFNLDKATTKHALQTASDKFGVDLSAKKARIKELLTEEM